MASHTMHTTDAAEDGRVCIIAGLPFLRLNNPCHDDHRQNLDFRGTQDKRYVGKQTSAFIPRDIVVVVIIIIVILWWRRCRRGYVTD